jgi:hypothetical protein
MGDPTDQVPCPECGAREMYTDRNNAGRCAREIIGISGHKIFLDTYLCLACGYFVERIPQKQLDEAAPRIRKEWEKI